MSVAAWALAACLLAPRVGAASEYHGQVTFGGSPVPGATVTATQGDKKISVVSDAQGTYFFPDLANGTWKIVVEMRFFKPIEQEVTVGATTTPGTWELALLPTDQIMAQTKLITTQPAVKPPSASVQATATTPAAPKSGAAKKADTPVAAGAAPSAAPEEAKPSDGFLINGSVNNAATSQFSLAPAFGNTRSGVKNLYNGGVSVVLDNSALDARSFSTSGIEAPKPAYNRIVAGFTIGGPINIKHLMPRGPNMFLAYQITRQSTANTLEGLLPTANELAGNFAGVVNSQGQPVVMPGTTLPFPNNNTIPMCSSTVTQNCITAQAQAFLMKNGACGVNSCFPTPNIPLTNGFNYQIPVLNTTHQDAMQFRLNKGVTRKDNVDGGFAFQDTRTSSQNLFGFIDKTAVFGFNGNINEHRRLTPRLYLNVGYILSRLRVQVIPNFEGSINVSGKAGIAGNLQDPADYGPPTLAFAASGISGPSDANSSFNRNLTNEGTVSVNWYHGKHNVTGIFDFQRKEFNDLAQQNPRGTFTFNSLNNAKSSGLDFADFLLGNPYTSAIAYGNADKYFRQSVYAFGVTDDWRVRPELTINAGMRWEYGAPMTELKNRLVNIDVAQNFAKAPYVLPGQTGSASGTAYPTSLIRPDKAGFQPRVGISWRPIAGSTLVIKAGYGIYADTSVYNATSLLMAQQAPLSTSLQVTNSSACPITLAAGFVPCATSTADTFGIDPNFRVGYAQTWQVLAQRDLPFAMQGSLTYLGIKGTRGVQEFLPNSYPIGGTSPCPSCPVGYAYRTSNGDSTRESISGQLRRRLKNGFTASVNYTFSKSIDDDAFLGGQGPVAAGAGSGTAGNVQIAQNWLNLHAERGLSTFDQRHLLTASAQYTSGQGIGGGSLMEGWRGTLLKEWTVLTSITAGSGLPETPIYAAVTPGTAFSGYIRASLTGAPIYSGTASGHYLNSAAYSAPALGQWGNAGRDSIEGPGTFSLNSSLARTFRLKGRYNLDTRVDATNTLNHVVFSSYYNTINNSLFGTPTGANSMRTLQITMRLRY
jgi:hypothetical protein